jgi:hypothetical protein
MTPRIAHYAEFWPNYLRAHRDRRTRAAHYLGSLLGVLCLLAAPLADWRLVAAAPIIGYGCAWFGHFVFEGNRPATFGHPLWSFYSDFRMAGLALARRLKPELEKAFRS